MKLVIDTNIIFSALLKKDSYELKIIQAEDFELFIPKFLVIEILKHKERIVRVSKLDESEVLESFYLILKYCTVFNEEDIPDKIAKRAFEYVKDVDPKDVVFVATALTLGARLWSGDKKLSNALLSKNVNLPVKTIDLIKRLEIGIKDR